MMDEMFNCESKGGETLLRSTMTKKRNVRVFALPRNLSFTGFQLGLEPQTSPGILPPF